MSQLQCPSKDGPTGLSRPVTPHPLRTRSIENIPEYVVSTAPRSETYLGDFDISQDFIEDTQPIYEDLPNVFEDSFERIVSQVEPRLPSPEPQPQVYQTAPSPPPTCPVTPQICPGTSKPPSPINIPAPPKDKSDYKAYVERARAIHQKLLREGKVSSAAASKTLPVELPDESKGKGRQPISRWPGGKPPGTVSKQQPRQVLQSQAARAQHTRGQPTRSQATRGQLARDQSSRGQTVRTQPTRGQLGTKEQLSQVKCPRPSLKRPPMFLKKQVKAPSSKAPVSNASVSNVITSETATTPIDDTSSAYCAAIARARRFAGLKSTTPQLNPVVAARIAAEKAEAERLEALPEYERIQERMKRLRKTPTPMRKAAKLSPTKLGALEAIRATTMPVSQLGACPIVKSVPPGISQDVISPSEQLLQPSDRVPRENVLTLPPSSAIRRPRRQLKYDTSPVPAPVIAPLPQQRPWRPAVRKPRHTDSKLWHKRFHRVFSGGKRKGSRRLDVLPTLFEEECIDTGVSEMEGRETDIDEATGYGVIKTTLGEINEEMEEASELNQCEEEILQSPQIALQSTGAIARVPPSTETVAEWERLKMHAQMLMTPPATQQVLCTAEEMQDEYEELEQMFEQIHGETPQRAPSPGICPQARVDELMKDLLGSPGAAKKPQMHRLVVPSLPPMATQDAPAYVKLADLKYRQKIFQEQMESAEAQALSDLTEEVAIGELEKQYQSIASGIDWTLHDIGPEETLTPVTTKYTFGAPQEFIQCDDTISPEYFLPTKSIPAFNTNMYDFDEELKELEELEDIEELEDMLPVEFSQLEDVCPMQLPQIEETGDISQIELADLSSGGDVDIELDYEDQVTESVEPTKQGFLASVVGTVFDTVKNIFTKPKEVESVCEQDDAYYSLDTSLPNIFVEFPPSPEQPMQPEGEVCPNVEVVCPSPKAAAVCPKPESPIVVPPHPEDIKDRKALIERARALHKLQQREAAKAPRVSPPKTNKRKREIKSTIPKARPRVPIKRKQIPAKKEPKKYLEGYDADRSEDHCAAVARARQLAGLRNESLQLHPEIVARRAAEKEAMLAEMEAKRKAREEELAAEAALPGPDRYKKRIERLTREGQRPICPRPTVETLGKLEAIKASLTETGVQQPMFKQTDVSAIERFKQLQRMREQAAMQQPQIPTYEDVETTPPSKYVPITLDSPKKDVIQRERIIHTIGSHGGQEITKQTVVEESTIVNGEVHTDVQTTTTKMDEFGNFTCYVQEGTGQIEEENLENITEMELSGFLDDIPAPIDPSVPTPGEIIQRIRNQVRNKLSSAITVPTTSPPRSKRATQIPIDENEEDILEVSDLSFEDICPEEEAEPEIIQQSTECALDTTLPEVFVTTPPPSPMRVPSPVSVPAEVCPPQSTKAPSPITVPPHPKDASDYAALIARAKAIQALKLKEQQEAAAAGISTKVEEKAKKRKREPISRRQPISRREKQPPPKKVVPSRGAQVTSRKKGIGVKSSVAPGELRPLPASHFEAIARARKLGGYKCTKPELNPELAAQIAAEKAEAERFAALPEYEKIQERMGRLRQIPVKRRKSPISPSILGALAGIRSTLPYSVPKEVEATPAIIQGVVAEPTILEPSLQTQTPQQPEHIVLPSVQREKQRERYKEILEPKWTPRQRKYIQPQSDIYRKQFRDYHKPKGKRTKPLQIMSPISELAEEVCSGDAELDEFLQYEKEFGVSQQFEAQPHLGDLSSAFIQKRPVMEREFTAAPQEMIGQQPLEIPTFQPKYSSIPDWVIQHYQEEVQDFVKPTESVLPTNFLLEPYVPTASPMERLQMIKEAQERICIPPTATEEVIDTYVEETPATQYAPLVLESPTQPTSQPMSSEQLLIDIEGPQKLPPKRLEDLEGCPPDIAFIEYESVPEMLDVFQKEPISPPPPQPSDIISKIRKEVLERMQEESTGQPLAQPQPFIQPEPSIISPVLPLPEVLPEEDIYETDMEEDICETGFPTTTEELDSSLLSVFQEPIPEEPIAPPPIVREPSPVRVPDEVCPPQSTKVPSPITVPPHPKDASDYAALIARARAIQALKLKEQQQAAAAGISTKVEEKSKKRKREPISRRQPISRREKQPPPKKVVPSRGAQVTSRKKGIGVKSSVAPGELRPLPASHFEAIARARKLGGYKCTKPELNPELAAQIAAEKAEAERFAALPEYEKLQVRMGRIRGIPPSQRKKTEVPPQIIGTLLGIRSTMVPDLPQSALSESIAPPCPQARAVSPSAQLPPCPQLAQTETAQPSAEICPDSTIQCPVETYAGTPKRAAVSLHARRRLQLGECPTSALPSLTKAHPGVHEWRPAVRKAKYPRSGIWHKKFPRVFAGTKKKGSRPLEVMDVIGEDQVLEELDISLHEEADIYQAPEKPIITSIECLPPLHVETTDDVEDVEVEEAAATEEVECIMAELDQWEKEYEQIEQSFQAELAAIEAEEGDQFSEIDALTLQKTELEEFLEMEEKMLEQQAENLDEYSEMECDILEQKPKETEEQMLDEFEELEAFYEGIEGGTPMRIPVQEDQQFAQHIASLEKQLEGVPCPAAPAEEKVIVGPRERYRQIVERQLAPPQSPPLSPVIEQQFVYTPLTLSSPTSGRVQTSTAQIISGGPSTIKEQHVETAKIENGELQQVVTQIVTTTDPQGNISYQVNQNRHVTAKDVAHEEDICTMEEPELTDITLDYVNERPRPMELIERIRREVLEGRRPEGRPEVPTGMLVDFGPPPPPAPHITDQEDISSYTYPLASISPPAPPKKKPQRTSPVLPALPTEIDSCLPEYFALPPTPPSAAHPAPVLTEECPAAQLSPKPRAPSPIVVPSPPKDTNDYAAIIARARAIQAVKIREQAAAVADVPKKEDQQTKKIREPISRRRPISLRGKKATTASKALARKEIGKKSSEDPGEIRPPPSSHFEAIARARNLGGYKCTRPELNPELAARIAAEKADAERFAALSEYEKIQERMQKARTKGIKPSLVKANTDILASLEQLKQFLPVQQRYEMLKKRSPVPPTTERPELSPRSRYKRIIQQPPPPPCPSPPVVEEAPPDFTPITLLSPERPGIAAELGTIPQFQLEGIESVEDIQMTEELSFVDDQESDLADVSEPSQRQIATLINNMQSIKQAPLQIPYSEQGERCLTPYPASAIPTSGLPVEQSERSLTPYTIPYTLPSDLPEEELMDYSLEEELLDYNLPICETEPLQQPQRMSPVHELALEQSLNISLPTMFEVDNADQPVQCPTMTEVAPVDTAQQLSVPSVQVHTPECVPTGSSTVPITIPSPPTDVTDREAYIKRARAIHQLQQQQAALCPQKSTAGASISKRTLSVSPAKRRAVSASSVKAVKASDKKLPPQQAPPIKEGRSKKTLKRPPMRLRKKGAPAKPVSPVKPSQTTIDAIARARQLAGIKVQHPTTQQPPQTLIAQPVQLTAPETKVCPTPQPSGPVTYESIMARAAALKPTQQKLRGRQMAAAQRLKNLKQREERLATPCEAPTELVFEPTLTPYERFRAIKEKQATARETSPVRTPPTVPFYIPPPRIELAESPSKIDTYSTYTYNQPLLEEEAAPEFYEDYESPVRACVAEVRELNQNITALHDQILNAPKKRVYPREYQAAKRRLDFSQMPEDLDDFDDFMYLEEECGATPRIVQPVAATPSSGFNVNARISALQKRLAEQECPVSPPTPDYYGLSQFFATPPQMGEVVPKIQKRPAKQLLTARATQILPKQIPSKQIVKPTPARAIDRKVYQRAPPASKVFQAQSQKEQLPKRKQLPLSVGASKVLCPKQQAIPKVSTTARASISQASRLAPKASVPPPQSKVSTAQISQRVKGAAPQILKSQMAQGSNYPIPQIRRPQSVQASTIQAAPALVCPKPQVSRLQVPICPKSQPSTLQGEGISKPQVTTCPKLQVPKSQTSKPQVSKPQTKYVPICPKQQPSHVGRLPPKIKVPIPQVTRAPKSSICPKPQISCPQVAQTLTCPQAQSLRPQVSRGQSISQSAIRVPRTASTGRSCKPAQVTGKAPWR